jgi:hypothetical protein
MPVKEKVVALGLRKNLSRLRMPAMDPPTTTSAGVKMKGIQGDSL